MCQSDRQCIDDCLNGHADAYRHLVRRYQGPITSYLVGRLGDEDAACEVTQESFVRAYFRLHALRDRDSFFPWLMGIAHHVMRETIRRERRRQSLSETTAPVAPSDRHSEARAEVTRGVADLPEIYRQVIVLRYYGRLSCAEVGKLLNVPLGTVTKRLSRAYALLRESLPPPGDQVSEVR